MPTLLTVHVDHAANGYIPDYFESFHPLAENLFETGFKINKIVSDMKQAKSAYFVHSVVKRKKVVVILHSRLNHFSEGHPCT
jgi:hypothetical protein